MIRSLADTARALLAKAVEQGTLFDAPLIPVKKVVRRQDGTHVQTFHVKPDEAPATAPAPAAPAPAPEPHTLDLTGQHDDVLTRHGLPLGTSVEQGVRSPLTRGKYRVGNSNYHDTIENAAKEARGFMEQTRGAERDAREHAAAEATVATKLRAGEQPTKDEWAAALGDHYEARRQIDDGYIEQAAIGGFLRAHFPHKGFTGSQLRKHLGVAAIETQNQWGRKYPAVSLTRLPTILRDEPATADAAPASAPPAPPGPPDTPEALDARLTEVLQALIADPKERSTYAQHAAADEKATGTSDPEHVHHARRAAGQVLGGYKAQDATAARWRARLYDAFSDDDKRLAPLNLMQDKRPGFGGAVSDETLKSGAAYGIARVRAERIARTLLADLPAAFERPKAPPLPLAMPDARIPARPKQLPSGDWAAHVGYAVEPGQTLHVTTRSGESWDAIVTDVMSEAEDGMVVTTRRVTKGRRIAKAAGLPITAIAERLIAKAFDPTARAAPPKGLKAVKKTVRRATGVHQQTFHVKSGQQPATATPPAADPSKATRPAVPPTAAPKAAPKYEHATVVAPDIHLPKYHPKTWEQLPDPKGPGTHALVKMHDTHPHHPGQEFRVPKASLAQHLDEMHQRVTGTPNHESEHVNAVIRGEGKHLGRGNDGMAFKVGDKVVKVAGVTPFQPGNHHSYRTPEEAAARLQSDATISQRLHAAGVPMIPKTEIHHHEGRAFMIRDHLDIPEKLTKQDLDEVRDGMTALHRTGHALKDDIQVGRGKDGRLYHFDTGTLDVNRESAHEGYRGPDDDILRDHERLEALYREHGHKMDAPTGGPMLHRELKKHAHEALILGQNHGDKHDPDNALEDAMEYDPVAHTEHLNDLHARVVADTKKHHVGAERDRLLAEADEHLRTHAKMLAKGRKMRAGLDAREKERGTSA